MLKLSYLAKVRRSRPLFLSTRREKDVTQRHAFVLQNSNRIRRARNTAGNLKQPRALASAQKKPLPPPLNPQTHTKKETPSTISQPTQGKKKKGVRAHLQRHTTKKTTPPPLLLTIRRQPLQIKQLPNRHAPTRKQPLMQRVLRIRVRPQHRPPLETRRVARHRGEAALPHPPQRLAACFQPDEVGRGPCGDGALLAGGERLERAV